LGGSWMSISSVYASPEGLQASASARRFMRRGYITSTGPVLQVVTRQGRILA
jgi:hypothetical protein